MAAALSLARVSEIPALGWGWDAAVARSEAPSVQVLIKREAVERVTGSYQDILESPGTMRTAVGGLS